VIGGVETHLREELLEHDGNLLEALVILYVVLDQLATGKTQVVFVLQATRDQVELVKDLIFLLALI
jgi:hypothetical protein